MKANRKQVQPQRKSPTGVTGFDEVTGGGLPTGCTTLLVGGPGSGKTILSLQYFVDAKRDVAFAKIRARRKKELDR